MSGCFLPEVIEKETKPMDKLIISACICGAEVTKEQNPAVPYTVEEIVREAKSAYDAGAALIHLHVRWDDGTPTQDTARFQECIDAIRKECPDAIIQPSTGGAVGMTDLERLASTDVVPTPEMATLDCGTCNFGGDEIFVNSDNTIINFAKIMQERGIKPEREVFDRGMIHTALKTAHKKGYLTEPIHWDFVLGVSTPATIPDLCYMVNAIPAGSTWTATGLGNLYLEKGVLAKSNGEMVEKAVKLAKILGREVATPAEAREILGLAPLK